MLSIVSPAFTFSLSAHHVAGNSDLPTFTFISFLATTLPHLGRQNCPRHILNMALSLCSVLCSELASERIFYLHVPCLLPDRLTEVSSDVHV